jgi:putative molybdopterin biosynthesis protein
METDISYTTEDIAKLLKISKLTVYDLIKKGELPAYRVGKQMRVDAKDLESYKLRAKSGGTGRAAEGAAGAATSGAGAVSRAAGADTSRIVITGQDISLDLLAKRLEQRAPGFRPLRSYVGSMDSLIAMYRGEADIVSTHLLDGDSGDYNIPYIRRVLCGFSYIVVNLVSRTAGLYTAPGNPLGLASWADLAKPGLRLVNREKGSGARVLLDEQLRMHGIARERLAGYEREETSHLAVAAKVKAGEADVGIGIEKASSAVGIGFVPLIRERYDLVMLKTPATAAWLPAVLALLRDPAFRSELGALQGYDVTHTGRVWLET